MDAVKILIPFFILLAAHIWAKRWTWVPTWCAIASVIGAAECLGHFKPAEPWSYLIAGAWALVIFGFLVWVSKASNKRTISKDIWALFKKGGPEYSPIKGWACVSSWLLFAHYLFMHLRFKW